LQNGEATDGQQERAEITEGSGADFLFGANFFPRKLVQVAQVDATWCEWLQVVAERLRFRLHLANRG
jgi:hypothetical protein